MQFTSPKKRSAQSERAILDFGPQQVDLGGCHSYPGCDAKSNGNGDGIPVAVTQRKTTKR